MCEARANTDLRKNLLGQKGITLFELLVVVAIIGILSSMAVSNYGKSVSRSRQSEAKMALASIYNLEKAFYSEYSAYIPSLAAIGFEREGARRYYRVGWVSGFGPYAGTIQGFSGPIMPFESGTLASPYTDCSLGSGGYTVSPVAAPFDVNDPQSFSVAAGGQLKTESTGIWANRCDFWTIDDVKRLRNTLINL